MVTIPRLLHLTSKHVPLRGFEARLAKRNLAVLGDWDVKVWSDSDNAALIRRHIPEHLHTFHALPFGVMRADISRLLYLHAFGGWYADTDYEWLARPTIAEAHDLVLPVSRESEGDPVLLGNAVMGSVPGHPFWRQVLDAAFSDPDIMSCSVDQVEATTGPGLLTREGLSKGEPGGAWLAPREYFHGQPSPQLVGVHLCQGSWRDDRVKWQIALLVKRLRRWRDSRLQS